MAQCALIFYPQNSEFVLITGLQDQSTDPATYVNSGTFTATLNDSNGDAVAGATAMEGSYVAGSDGNWQFELDPDEFDPPVGYSYTLVISGSSEAGAQFYAEIPAWVVTRSAGTET